MSLDFQQVQDQVRQLGENAQARQQELLNRRQLADELLEKYARQFDLLRQKVEQAAHNDSSLRCALPLSPEVAPAEALNAVFSVPPLPRKATVLARQQNPSGTFLIPYPPSSAALRHLLLARRRVREQNRTGWVLLPGQKGGFAEFSHHTRPTRRDMRKSLIHTQSSQSGDQGGGQESGVGAARPLGCYRAVSDRV